MAEHVLHLAKFPTLNRPQRDTEGRLWRVVEITAPYCLAALWEHGPDGPFERYRIEVVRHSAHVHDLRLAGAI